MAADTKPATEPEAEAVEGEAVEIAVTEETETYAGEEPTMLVPAPTSGGVITPLDPEQVVQGMEAYQQLLPRLLKDNDYQEAGRGKRFVKKSGWRKIAKAFGLSVEIVSSTVERNEEGEPTRATVIARAIHPPTGQFSDGDGHCSLDEDRFSGPRGNKSKLENDLRATATTRAKNRAIADLVGMGEVSAEEADGGGNRPPHGEAADQALVQRTSNALIYLFGDLAEGVWNEVVEKCGGYMPQMTAEGIVLLARKIKDHREKEAESNKAAEVPNDTKGEKDAS